MSKEEVRNNRQRIRKNMISCLIHSSCQHQENGQNKPKLYTPQVVLRRRKTSQDVRILDDIAFLKQIYLDKSFQQMYELQQKVGQGAHSTVFKCKQIKTGLIYAAKIFKTVELQNIRNMKQHYKIKRSLPQQNIIRPYNLFINEKLKKVQMVVQYCPYPDLREFIRKHKQTSEQQIAQIVYNILKGLEHLHKNGVCHRDVKPQNILYNEQTKQLKLIDFQLAKMSKYTYQKLQMWTNTGTLHYKAPEMFNGSYNQLIDVWAVGVIAYQLTYNKMPFQKQYLSQTIQAICQKDLQFQQKNVSSFLLNFLKRTLTKNPSKRITAHEALHTPFLLKFIDQKLNKSQKIKIRVSKTDSDDDFSYIKSKGTIQCPQEKSSYEQQDLLNNKKAFSQDIGIRFLQG